MAIKNPVMSGDLASYCVDCPFNRAIQVVSVEYDPNTGRGQMRTIRCEHSEACRRMHDIKEAEHD